MSKRRLRTSSHGGVADIALNSSADNSYELGTTYKMTGGT